MHMHTNKQLVGAIECIAIVFPCETSRPALRTYRKWQANGWIPHLKVGHLTYFDPDQVRAALDRRFKINAVEVR